MAKHSHNREAEVAVSAETDEVAQEAVEREAERRAADDTVAEQKAADAEAAAPLEGEVMSGETNDESAEGKRARTTFTTKLFLPERKLLAAGCLDKPKGTVMLLGRVFGMVTSADLKQSQLPDGTPSSMPRLQGAFETYNYLTGEVGSAVTAYLPRSFSGPFLTHFSAEKGVDKLAEIDVDVGVESTGKIAIPYEWVVIAHIEGGESQRMKALRTRRGTPAQLRIAANATLQLTDQRKG